MIGKKLLVIHGSITPFRIDFFNKLAESFDLKVYFFYEEDPSQKFNMKELKRNALFSFDFILTGFKLFGRVYRFGFLPILLKENPDIVITHEFSSFSLKTIFYKLSKGTSVKWYITSDDSIGSLTDMPKYRRVARKIILPFIDGLITINIEVKQWHLKNYPNLDLNVFDFPILQDPAIFRKRLNDALPITEGYIRQYNLVGKKVILYVGRLVKEKGVDRLVKVFTTIPDENARLLIVGDGVLKATIDNFLIKKKEKRVILVGRFDGLELVAWYNVASLFILPSNYEPFGTVVNEALLSGLYTICSEKAGANILIEENQNGDLLDPIDDEDIERKINNNIIKLGPVLSNVKGIRKNLMKLDFATKMKELENFLK